jgi:hypothetical protein
MRKTSNQYFVYDCFFDHLHITLSLVLKLLSKQKYSLISMHLRHIYMYYIQVRVQLYQTNKQWQMLFIRFLIYKSNTNISKEPSNDHTCYNLTISLGV